MRWVASHCEQARTLGERAGQTIRDGFSPAVVGRMIAERLRPVFGLAELILRASFADTAYVPGQEIRAVQSYLKPHPRVGYLWKENLRPDKDRLLSWADEGGVGLSTDEVGFFNSPQAIQVRRSGHWPEIIGLGDSFMHNASFAFHDFFWQHGMFFYSMAMHRHCPPQYNLILKECALPIRPRWIVYGVFENDFTETTDFENWRTSGLNWFDYHSGTWYGPARPASRSTRFLETTLSGWWALKRSLCRRLMARPQVSPIQPEAIRAVFR